MAKKIDPASVTLAAALRKQIVPFANAVQSEDTAVSTLRESALTIGGEVLDATARLTDAERKAHIECFISEVCKQAGYSESSIADRSSMMRAMIYASPHRDNILKLADHAAKQHEGIYQRARLIERTARHVKSRLTDASAITLAALKRWIDDDAKKRVASKRKARRAAKAGPLAKLNAALAFLCDNEADYSDAIAAGYLSHKLLESAVALRKEINSGNRLKLDSEYSDAIE